MTDTITIAVLAGGQSTRMGEDKAMLAIDGETLLARIAAAARSTGRRTLVVGRSRPESWAMPEVDFVDDPAPGLGPIGGLLAALKAAGGPVLMVACDMPRLTAGAINWLAHEAEARPEAKGVVVQNGDQLEPLFSVYFPTLLPTIETRVTEGRRSLHGLFTAAKFDYVDAPADIADCLVNVNTAEEWRKFGG
jgi:molybdopterin-guanine dinucleotide biosynthesis protein A